MDNQPMPPNPVTPNVQPSGVNPESLQSVPAAEQARPAEVAPVPGGTPAPSVSPVGGAPSKLTPDDVAAALAAIPGPTPTAVPVAPASADDVDVIEPEWVAKAEDVVRAHQGDPYGEEEAIEDLQQDYLQKRYGHKVADPNADSSKQEGT